MADPTPTDPPDPVDPADRGAVPSEDVVDFGWADPEVAVMRMDELARRRDGWLNVSPRVDYEEPPPGALAKLFGTRGPMIPVGTWIPGAPTRGGGVDPTTVGLQHGMGQRLLFALREAGQGVPEGWRTLQDHARRGVVLQIPDDTDPAVVLDWIMRVSEIVLPSDPTGRFRATIHRR